VNLRGTLEGAQPNTCEDKHPTSYKPIGRQNDSKQGE
jgi:hypothetical protein